jgi:hypothetical protein
MRLGRRIAAIEAKLLAVSKRCAMLKRAMAQQLSELTDCNMVKAELKRLIEELYQKKKDRENP